MEENEDLDLVGDQLGDPVIFFKAAAVAAGVIRKGDPLDQMLVDFAYAIVERCAVIGLSYADDDFGNAGDHIRAELSRLRPRLL